MKTKIEIEVEVPQNWIDFCTKHSDLFGQSYCGYWAFGAHHDAQGWLVFEEGAGGDLGGKLLASAIKAWKKGERLPKGFYRLDEFAAIKAFAEGCKKWGTDWYDTRGDANDYDVAIQIALLGEVVYG